MSGQRGSRNHPNKEQQDSLNKPGDAEDPAVPLEKNGDLVNRLAEEEEKSQSEDSLLDYPTPTLDDNDNSTFEPLEMEVTYITESIIAISFPGSCNGQPYRENLESVTKMIQLKHSNHYMVINLSEPTEELKELNKKVVECGWPPDLAPSLETLCSLCKAIDSWLNASQHHVIVLHCRGGKGRLGVVVAAYNEYSGISASSDQDLDRFAMKYFYHTKLEPFVQPSQKRYVKYFSDLLNEKVNIKNTPIELHAIVVNRLVLIRHPDGKGRIYFKIYQSLEKTFVSPVYVIDPGHSQAIIQFDPPLSLQGDVLLKCFQKKVGRMGRNVIIRCQFHVGTMQSTSLHLSKVQLDEICTDPRCPQDAALLFHFEPVDTGSIPQLTTDSVLSPSRTGNSYEDFPPALKGSDSNSELLAIQPPITHESEPNNNTQPDEETTIIPVTNEGEEMKPYKPTSTPISINGIPSHATVELSSDTQYSVAQQSDQVPYRIENSNPTTNPPDTKTSQDYIADDVTHAEKVTSEMTTTQQYEQSASDDNLRHAVTAQTSQLDELLNELMGPTIPVAIQHQTTRTSHEQSMRNEQKHVVTKMERVTTTTATGRSPGARNRRVESETGSLRHYYPPQGAEINRRYSESLAHRRNSHEEKDSISSELAPSSSPNSSWLIEKQRRLRARKDGFDWEQRANQEQQLLEELKVVQAQQLAFRREASSPDENESVDSRKVDEYSERSLAPSQVGDEMAQPQRVGSRDVEQRIIRETRIERKRVGADEASISLAKPGSSIPSITTQSIGSNQRRVESQPQPAPMPIRIEAQPLFPEPQPLGSAQKYKSETSIFVNPAPDKPLGKVEYTVTISPRRRPFTPQPSDFTRSTLTRKTTTSYRPYTPQPSDFSQRVLITGRRGDMVTTNEFRSNSTNLFETLPRFSRTSQDILRSSSVAADRTDNFRNWYHYKMEDERQRKGSLNLVPPPTGQPKLSPVYYDNAPRSNTPRTLYTEGGMIMQPIRTAVVDQHKVPRPVPIKSYDSNMSTTKYARTTEAFQTKPTVQQFRDRIQLQPIGVHTISSNKPLAPQDDVFEDEYKLQAIGIQNLDSGQSQPATPAPVIRDDLKVLRSMSRTSGESSSTLPLSVALPPPPHPQPVEVEEGMVLQPIGAGLYPLETSTPKLRSNLSYSTRSLPRTRLITRHQHRQKSYNSLLKPENSMGSGTKDITTGAVAYGRIIDALDLQYGAASALPRTNRDHFASPPIRSASVPPQMVIDQMAQQQQQRGAYFETGQKQQFQPRVVYPTGSLRHQSSSSYNQTVQGAGYPLQTGPAIQPQAQRQQNSRYEEYRKAGLGGYQDGYIIQPRQQQQMSEQHYSHQGQIVNGGPRAFDFAAIGSQQHQDGAFPVSQKMSLSHHKEMHTSETRTAGGEVYRNQPQFNESLQRELHVDTAGGGGGMHESSFQQTQYGYGQSTSAETPGFPLSSPGGQPAFAISSNQDSLNFVKDVSRLWYRSTISRDEAIKMLQDRPPGSFVVRDSTSYAGSFGLAIKVAQLPPNMAKKSMSRADYVRHFLIETTSHGVRLKGCPNEPVFSSLASLVYQHTITALALPCKLLLPEESTNDLNASEHFVVDESERVQLSRLEAVPKTADELILKGAASNVLYINSVDTESLTGPQAISKALFETQKLKPEVTVCHFKVAADGITLTDLNRKLFFRRHFAADSITYCGLDPEDRRWSNKDEHIEVTQARLFGFVARKANSKAADNMCHIFAELDPNQPATAIVNFISKFLIGVDTPL